MNCLQIAAGNLIRTEQKSAVEGKSIQNKLHLVSKIIEGIEDDNHAVLMNLDQSKAFDRVDHGFLVAVLETAKFKPEFRRWISILYHNPTEVVEVNKRCLMSFAIKRSVQ